MVEILVPLTLAGSLVNQPQEVIAAELPSNVPSQEQVSKALNPKGYVSPSMLVDPMTFLKMSESQQQDQIALQKKYERDYEWLTPYTRANLAIDVALNGTAVALFTGAAMDM